MCFIRDFHPSPVAQCQHGTMSCTRSWLCSTLCVHCTTLHILHTAHLGAVHIVRGTLHNTPRTVDRALCTLHTAHTAYTTRCPVHRVSYVGGVKGKELSPSQAFMVQKSEAYLHYAGISKCHFDSKLLMALDWSPRFPQQTFLRIC